MSNNALTAEKLGKIDRNILRILQKDGRISYTDLAREVGLSVTHASSELNALSAMAIFLAMWHRSAPSNSMPA